MKYVIGDIVTHNESMMKGEVVEVLEEGVMVDIGLKHQDGDPVKEYWLFSDILETNIKSTKSGKDLTVEIADKEAERLTVMPTVTLQSIVDALQEMPAKMSRVCLNVIEVEKSQGKILPLINYIKSMEETNNVEE